MARYISAGFLAVVIGIGVLLANSIFTVHQTQYALVLQLGEPVRTILEPGLKFKLPFIQNVRYFDNRILILDTDPFLVNSVERRRFLIDSYTRWRVTDPLAFYQTLPQRNQARERLTRLTTSNLTDVVAAREFQALLSPQRAEIMREVRDRVNSEVSRLGIEIVDVRILRAELPDQIAQTVYERMSSEFQAQAQEARSRGRAVAQRIQSAADRDRTILLANARRDAEIIRGEGDAERNNIFAEAYGQDPDFFVFYRTMRAYERSLSADDTRLVLSPNSDFFEYFISPEGR